MYLSKTAYYFLHCEKILTFSVVPEISSVYPADGYPCWKGILVVLGKHFCSSEYNISSMPNFCYLHISFYKDLDLKYMSMFKVHQLYISVFHMLVVFSWRPIVIRRWHHIGLNPSRGWVSVLEGNFGCLG